MRWGCFEDKIQSALPGLLSQGGVPASMHGLAVATMMLCANFFGSLASLVVGASLQGTTPNDYDSLATVLLVRIPIKICVGRETR